MAGPAGASTPSSQKHQNGERISGSGPGPGSAARAVREKGPHASREGSAQRAAQDVEGLKDYQLGDCLGKGAFGSVYRALNWGTGETVAIKQVKLVDLPKSELKVIMLEIDLLKNLNHPNIVKYNGSVKSSESLYIILEYCENGSLHSICKNFGKFPENLVALYMSQVLHGLVYLHDQGVIHRDIKGANILTTKEGLVKLADFGVATKAAGLDEANVVGTPYWMAPEVIELTGATTASDIWSLGCTVIELIEGRPPYHKLQPMQALFRIVNDEHPPLPASISPAVRDFLMQCFQKNSNLRISAKRLLKHPWIQSAKRADAVVPSEPTKYDEAVKSVQEWNEALKSPENGSIRRSTRAFSSSLGSAKKDSIVQVKTHTTTSNNDKASKPQINIPTPRLNPDVFRSPEVDTNNWDADFVSVHASSLRLPEMKKPQDHFAGQLSRDKLKAFATFDTVIEEGNSITSDPDLDRTLRSPVKPLQPLPNPSEAKRVISADSEVQPQKLAQRRKSSVGEPKTAIYRPLTKSHSAFQEKSVEDYSDIVVDGNEAAFRSKVESMQARKPSLAPKLFDPSDLTPISRTPRRTPDSTTRTHTRAASASEDTALQRSRSIRKYADDDGDADYSDMFNTRADSDSGSEVSALAINSKMSGSFIADDDDHDVFADFGDDLEANPVDQAKALRDQQDVRLDKEVEDLVGRLKTNQPFDVILEVAEQLLAVLAEHPKKKNIVLKSHGVLPILDILKESPPPPRDISLPLLKVLNLIILDNSEAQESLCYVGGIPAVTEFGQKRYSSEERKEAAAFVRQMCKTSPNTLNFFVACRGLDILVEFIEDDLDNERDIVLIGVYGIWCVFNLQGPTPKNDWCRILSQHGILHPLSLVLNRVLDDQDDVSKLVADRVVNIFYIFSQAENYVKQLVTDRIVMHRVLRDLRRMPRNNVITMLKSIKNLSGLSSTHDALETSNAIDILTDFMRASKAKSMSEYHDVSMHVIPTMYNLCRLNRSRQEEAALNGIIPLFKELIHSKSQLKEFTSPILCEMAHAGKLCRKKLWEQEGLTLYVSLLVEGNWQVTALDAIHVWLQEETARVEQKLLDGSFTQAITRLFSALKVGSETFGNILDPLQKILFLSPFLAATFASQTFFDKASEGFRVHSSRTSPVMRLNLLRMFLAICHGTEEQNSLLRKLGLYEVIRELAESDNSIMVRQLADDMVKSAYSRSVSSTPLRLRQASMGRKAGTNFTPTPTAAQRNRSGPRRPVILTQALPSPTTGVPATPPPLMHSMTAPVNSSTSFLPRESLTQTSVDVVSSLRRPSTSYSAAETGIPLRRPSTSHSSSETLSPSTLATPPTETRKASGASLRTPSSYRPLSRDDNSGGSSSNWSNASAISVASTASGASTRSQTTMKEEPRPSKVPVPGAVRLARLSLASGSRGKAKGEENMTPPETGRRPVTRGSAVGVSAPPPQRLKVHRRRQTSTGVAGERPESGASK